MGPAWDRCCLSKTVAPGDMGLLVDDSSLLGIRVDSGLDTHTEAFLISIATDGNQSPTLYLANDWAASLLPLFILLSFPTFRKIARA